MLVGPLGRRDIQEGGHWVRGAEGTGGLTAAIDSGGNLIPHLTHLQVTGGAFDRGMESHCN